jgi:glucosamine--fructose-6-phosphate aminotransferase (isomerizing)
MTKSESLMRQEIGQQPQVLSTLLDRETENTFRAAAQVASTHQVRYVLVAARGTSDNAARYGQYLLGVHNRLTVALATPSLYSVYGRPPRLEGALVIGISQSGQSPDIVAVLTEGRRQGVPTVAITNDTESPLAAQADFVIPLHAGPELSVAASKTYTAELVALALLSCALGGTGERLDQLQTIPHAAQEVLQVEDLVARAVERYRYAESCVVLGRGYNYSTAFEIALKLKELSYVIAEAYSSADFMHGPSAMLSEGFPALVVAPSGEMYDTMRDFSLELRSRGAELLVISDRTELLDEAVTPLPLPRVLPEWLSPITAAILGQLFALHLTKVKGHDPDRPRGLTKVTITR